MNDGPSKHTNEALVASQQTLQPGVPAEMQTGRQGSRFALRAGIGLIVLGALLLVGQFVPGAGLWRWWPVIVVAIEGGVSALEVRVSRGENVRVVMSDGLSGIEAEGEWEVQREDGRRIYQSDGFSEEGPLRDIRIESGISGITLAY